MRWDDVFIAGTGASLPAGVTAASAVAAGRYDAEVAARSRQLAVTVAGDGAGTAPEFAVGAARRALAGSGHEPGDVGILLHAVVLHDGIDAWNPATYIQRELGITQCVPAQLRMVCNGSLVGVTLACAFLRALPAQPAALITASDCWPDPVIDRWDAPGFVFGDGGGAVVLSREGGFARLLATATHTDPEVEGLTRGAEPFGPFRTSADNPIDLRRRAKEFLGTAMPDEELWKRWDDGMRAVADEVTADTGIRPDDVEHIITPFLDPSNVDRQYLTPLGLDPARTTWEHGRHIGHLGAADYFVALDRLAGSGQLAPRDRVLVLGAAGGTWCAVLLEIVAPPPARP
ncbi:3-oxoacyl-[acyl-carrier-protein] synthase 3 [Actinomadura rubteroloni]|uniref:3-oxoacyl-[acyl-carrier-protein] synthase 3 n=1 Tax=Actinomadura rubteroloni TaxID=1926885 RepID=A0A2P4UCR8_9ACTN|nr:ketoacyl-ACP synthase III family protein [Actinomadura rubteroloni]POM22822.1 3-oxoacyl-[acyl-carrier-protein] synthase 3 [Actinomadura rubteroloni]